jgi:hypothetical protein
MHRLLFPLVALLVVGCESTSTAPDFGATVTGCRAPSACYTLECPCQNASEVASECMVCNPTGMSGGCDCTVFDGGSVECLEPAQVCVGRASSTCTTPGARCAPSCDQPGVPPQLVSADDAGLERRCPYVGDHCCLGDAGVP